MFVGRHVGRIAAPRQQNSPDPWHVVVGWSNVYPRAADIHSTMRQNPDGISAAAPDIAEEPVAIARLNITCCGKMLIALCAKSRRLRCARLKPPKPSACSLLLISNAIRLCHISQIRLHAHPTAASSARTYPKPFVIAHPSRAIATAQPEDQAFFRQLLNLVCWSSGTNWSGVRLSRTQRTSVLSPGCAQPAPRSATPCHSIAISSDCNRGSVVR